MKILSLFDGMACGALAFKRADVQVDRYVAYEIDKYAIKVASHNFPMIEQRGNVFQADFTEFEGFDAVIGGSPCTYWSIAQKKECRETEAHGIGWELFQQYVRAIREAKPRFFIYENNKSMSDNIKIEISEAFGFEPIMINSALVSAQNRQRYYWVGIRNEDGTYRKADIDQPVDRGILLKDVIEEGWFTDKDKSHAVIGSMGRTTHREYFMKNQGQMVAEPVGETEDGKSCAIKAQYGKNSVANFITNGKYNATGVAERYDSLTESEKVIYEVKDGLITIKGKQYPIKLSDGFYIIRKLTVTECKRLQTVPDDYDMSVISNTQAYKCLGNGWTVEVIAHLITSVMEGLQ